MMITRLIIFLRGSRFFKDARYFQKNTILAYHEDLMDAHEKEDFKRHVQSSFLLHHVVKRYQQQKEAYEQKHPLTPSLVPDFDKWHLLQDLLKSIQQEQKHSEPVCETQTLPVTSSSR